MPASLLDPKGVDCEISQLVGEGNETFLIRVWKPIPNGHVLKTVRLTVIRNRPKQTISASGGLEGLDSYKWY